PAKARESRNLGAQEAIGLPEPRRRGVPIDRSASARTPAYGSRPARRSCGTGCSGRHLLTAANAAGAYAARRAVVDGEGLVPASGEREGPPERESLSRTRSGSEGQIMKVFVFDLLAYGEQLEHLKLGNELPYPLSNKHFNAEVAARTYGEHLDAWEQLDRLGYDGVGFNEHHCSPYGLMNSPNLLAGGAAERPKRPKPLIFGKLPPVAAAP